MENYLDEKGKHILEKPSTLVAGSRFQQCSHGKVSWHKGKDGFERWWPTSLTVFKMTVTFLT